MRENGKKKPIGITRKWSFDTANKEMLQAKFNGASVLGPARLIKIKGSGVICIDIDENKNTKRYLPYFRF